jgi:hypothetical protein
VLGGAVYELRVTMSVSRVGCIGSSLSCSGSMKCRSLAPSSRPALQGPKSARTRSEKLRIPKKASRQSASGSRHPRVIEKPSGRC